MVPPNAKAKSIQNDDIDDRWMKLCQNKGANRREAGDRFIPRRLNLDAEAANFYINRTEEKKGLFSQDPREPTHLWYNRMDLKYPLFSHVYDFSTIQMRRKNSILNKNYDNLWPINRSELQNRPGTIRPDHVYDLPNFRNNFYLNTIDWSSSGFFAASLGSFIYTWNPFTHTRDTFAEYHEQDSGTSLKWHPDGKSIVLGSLSGSFKVCDVALKKSAADGDCACEDDGFLCSVTSIAWHPVHSYSFAMGCTRGVVSAVDVRNGEKGHSTVIRCQRIFKNSVATLRFSPSNGQLGKFLAVSGRSNCIYILLWPDLTTRLKIRIASPCRALAWHPWKPSLLAMGIGAGNGSIHLMNVMTEKLILSHQPAVESSSYCLEWCPKSGLLISSHLVSPNETKILVLSSFNNVVQKMEGNFGRILYLLWSPNGSQLATAGSDETLRIWTLSRKSLINDSDKDKKLGSTKSLSKKEESLNLSMFIR